MLKSFLQAGPLSIPSAGFQIRVLSNRRVALDDFVKIIGFKDLAESFTVLAIRFVELDTVVDDIQNLLFAVDTRHFPGQARMPAQFAAQLHAIALKPFNNGSGGANLHTLAAVKALSVVNLRTRTFGGQRNCIFLAGIDAGLTTGTLLFGYHWRAGADDADIFDLWL